MRPRLRLHERWAARRLSCAELPPSAWAVMWSTSSGSDAVACCQLPSLVLIVRRRSRFQEQEFFDAVDRMVGDTGESFNFAALAGMQEFP